MRFFAFLLAFVVSPAWAVTAVADLPDQTTTHCVLELDGAWGADTPVVTISGVRLCAFDVTGVTTGAHTARVRAVKLDAVWGRLESAPSAPLAFTKPQAPDVPTGIRLAP